MKIRILLLSLFFIGLAGSAFAQPDTHLKYRKYRVSLVPGISSNGVEAQDYTAKYSLNLLAGYNGGLDGFEIGPVNVNKHYARGAQIGVVNVSGGEMTGLFLGGLVNVAREDMTGLHFSGLGNLAGGEMTGIQFSGLFNVANEDMSGIQITGIINTSNGEMNGIQLGGIANVSRYDMQGIQLSGIANVSSGNLQGVQLAGIANVNYGTSQGIIGSGIANVSRGSAQGIYYAGIMNYAREFQGVGITGGLNYSGTSQGILVGGLANVSNTFQGVQVAGLFNAVEDGQGIQIAPFNFGRDFTGVPVGLVSLYGNGRKQMDIWAADGGFTYAGFKTGTHEIYNMISIGYNPTITDRDVWALAWSIGVLRPLEEAWDHPRFKGYFVNLDFTVQHIQDGKFEAESLNHVYSYRYLLGKELSNGLFMYAGPTLNMMVSKNPNNDDYTWYTIHELTRKGRDYKFWVGATLGFQMF